MSGGRAFIGASWSHGAITMRLGKENRPKESLMGVSFFLMQSGCVVEWCLLGPKDSVYLLCLRCRPDPLLLSSSLFADTKRVIHPCGRFFSHVGTGAEKSGRDIVACISDERGERRCMSRWAG